MKDILDINCVLYTKDGRKIGNAIVIGRDGYFWSIKTDYGHIIDRITTEEIEDLFYVGNNHLTLEEITYKRDTITKHKHYVKR